MATIDIQKQLEEMKTRALEIQSGLTSVKDTGSTTLPKDFLDEFQKKLMGNLDIVSSETSPLESEIQKTITGIQEARTATETGIKAEFERGRTEIKQLGERKITSELEARRGFATNTALLKQLEEDTDKSLKDWDLREKQALAMGRTEEADKIAALRLQGLQFREQKKQQAFTNLFQMGQFYMSAESMRRQAEESKFNRAINTINLLKDFNLAGQFNASQIKDVENTLGLQSGAINKIIPKTNEKLDFYTSDNEGNVTAVYRDEKTNKIRTQVFKGIGGTKKTEEDKPLSKTMVNALAMEGIGEEDAQNIQRDLNSNVPKDLIIEQLERLNPGQGQAIWDKFERTVKKMQIIIPW